MYGAVPPTGVTVALPVPPKHVGFVGGAILAERAEIVTVAVTDHEPTAETARCSAGTSCDVA